MILDPRESVRQVITGAVELVNLELPDDQKIDSVGNTPIWGGGRHFDSLMLVNFLTHIEESLEDQFGFAIELMESEAILDPEGPLKNALELEEYLVGEVSRRV
jgi:hypothetical protein